MAATTAAMNRTTTRTVPANGIGRDSKSDTSDLQTDIEHCAQNAKGFVSFLRNHTGRSKYEADRQKRQSVSGEKTGKRLRLDDSARRQRLANANRTFEEGIQASAPAATDAPAAPNCKIPESAPTMPPARTAKLRPEDNSSDADDSDSDHAKAGGRKSRAAGGAAVAAAVETQPESDSESDSTDDTSGARERKSAPAPAPDPHDAQLTELIQKRAAAKAQIDRDEALAREKKRLADEIDAMRLAAEQQARAERAAKRHADAERAQKAAEKAKRKKEKAEKRERRRLEAVASEERRVAAELAEVEQQKQEEAAARARAETEAAKSERNRIAKEKRDAEARAEAEAKEKAECIRAVEEAKGEAEKLAAERELALADYEKKMLQKKRDERRELQNKTKANRERLAAVEAKDRAERMKGTTNFTAAESGGGGGGSGGLNKRKKMDSTVKDINNGDANGSGSIPVSESASQTTTATGGDMDETAFYDARKKVKAESGGGSGDARDATVYDELKKEMQAKSDKSRKWYSQDYEERFSVKRAHMKNPELRFGGRDRSEKTGYEAPLQQLERALAEGTEVVREASKSDITRKTNPRGWLESESRRENSHLTWPTFKSEGTGQGADMIWRAVCSTNYRNRLLVGEGTDQKKVKAEGLAAQSVIVQYEAKRSGKSDDKLFALVKSEVFAAGSGPVAATEFACEPEVTAENNPRGLIEMIVRVDTNLKWPSEPDTVSFGLAHQLAWKAEVHTFWCGERIIGTGTHSKKVTAIGGAFADIFRQYVELSEQFGPHTPELAEMKRAGIKLCQQIKIDSDRDNKKRHTLMHHLSATAAAVAAAAASDVAGGGTGGENENSAASIPAAGERGTASAAVAAAGTNLGGGGGGNRRSGSRHDSGSRSRSRSHRK